MPAIEITNLTKDYEVGFWRKRKVRALDEDTGNLLWETGLESALEGIPSVYELDGREYLVVCAAAAANPVARDKIHGAYVAFALPEGAGQSRSAEHGR